MSLTGIGLRTLAMSLLACSFLAGCAGLDSHAPLPVAPNPLSAAQAVTIRMTINGPGGNAQSGRRHPTFVSPSTNGVLAQAYSDSGYTTLVAQNAIDVSSGSVACGGATGFPRTCIGTMDLAPGSYWFRFTDYNAAPLSGSFSSALVLGIGAVPNFAVQLGVANQLSVFVSGLIANFGVANAAFTSLPADGATHTIGLVLAPTDANGNPIGTGNAPFANPISVTLSESGGTGHSALVLNGGAASSSATITRTTDTVVLQYDGSGAPGYTTSLAISASGVSTQSLTVSPMYVRSTSPWFAANALTFSAPSQSATLDLTEEGAPVGVSYSAVPNSGCSGVVSLGSMSGGGSSASVAVSNGAMLSATGCTLTLGDSLGTHTQIVAAVTNTATGGSIGIPTVSSITEFSAGIGGLAQPKGITLGPDGNLWFTESGSSGIGEITPQGVVSEHFLGISPNSWPVAIVSGPDGNLWFTECIGNRIGRMTPSGSVTEFSAGMSANAKPYDIAVGSDDALWFTEFSGNRIGRITRSGVISEYASGISANAYPWFIALGPDGNLWFTELSGRVARITTAGVVTEFSTGITPGSEPSGITAGPDGNMWFTEYSGNRIGRITPSGAVTEFSAGMTNNAFPKSITTGADGNLWFTESRTASLGRITPAGGITEFSQGMSANASPFGIVSGSDGNL
ncbi:MAG: Vgb family protein, partial [Vulcanimicrobiaceae bacterium]